MTDAPNDIANDMCLPLVMCLSPDLFPCDFSRRQVVSVQGAYCIVTCPLSGFAIQ
jgi:hypothetical protein